MTERKLFIKFPVFMIILGIFFMIAWSYTEINDKVKEFLQLEAKAVNDAIEEMFYSAEEAYYIREYNVTIMSKSLSGGTGPFDTFNDVRQEDTAAYFLVDSYDIYDDFKFSHFMIDTYSAEIISDITLRIISDVTVTAFYQPKN